MRRSRLLAMLLVMLTLSSWLTSSVRAEDIPTAKPEDVGLSTEGLKKVHEMMQGYIDKGQIQGGVTVVARHGKIVHFEAHGLADVANKKPMAKDDIFVMMSSSKPVTAVATLMMLDEGKLKLDDPISKFIPEFKGAKVAVPKGGESPGRGNAGSYDIVPAVHDLTVKDLLTHTGGLLSGGGGQTAAGTRQPRGRDATLADAIPRMGSIPLDFQPGTRWAYSSTAGPDVLGRVVEVCSGQTYDVFLQKRLFEPLGMKDTYFNVPTDKRARRVVRGTGAGGGARAARGGDATKSDAVPAAAATATAGGTKYFSGGAGLNSTAEDYLRFEQMLVHKGELFGKRILKPETVALMSSNQVGDLYSGLQRAENGMGFGFLVSVTVDNDKAKTGRANGAFGWGGAYGTMSWTDPAEDMTCVIMLQQSVKPVQKDFEKVVKAAIVGK